MTETSNMQTSNDKESCEETNEATGEVLLEEDLESDKDDGQQQRQQEDVEDGDKVVDSEKNTDGKIRSEDETKQELKSGTDEEKQQLELEQVETTSANTRMPQNIVNNDPESGPEDDTAQEVEEVNDDGQEGGKIKEHEAPEKGKVSKIKSLWQSGKVYNQSSNVKEKDSSYKKGYGVGLERAPVDKTAYEK